LLILPQRVDKMPYIKKKKLSQEEVVQMTSLEAITERYGSLKEGFIALLESKEAPLIRFVFEHAIGRPKEKASNDNNKPIQQVQVIQLPHNNRDNQLTEGNFTIDIPIQQPELLENNGQEDKE